MSRKVRLVLIAVITLAFFLRFYKLGENPPSLTWDEVAWGYNAYSLGIDGRDEFGRFLPHDYLESFGDFKPPVYAYLDIIPVKLFGLTEFAVRFPSAFFGVLTVLVTYFLTKRIFPNAKSALEIRNLKLEIPEVAALLLAISPWHINLSRAAFEANIATFFLVLGVFLFLTAMHSRGVTSFTPPRWNYVHTSVLLLSLSGVSFILSMYTFNTARIVAPLLILILVIGFRRELLTQKKQVLIATVVGMFLIVPLTQFLLTPQARLRFHEVNIFSDISIIEKANQQIENDHNVWWSKILHNRRFAFSTEFIKHYLDNVNPQFLFIKGDGNPKFSTQDVGQLYLWELPFLVGGIVLLIKRREGFWWIIPFWLLVGIIPAATARETPHALRIETTLPMFQIIVAYGVIYAFNAILNSKNKIANIQIKYLIFALCFLFLIFNFLYYYHGYYAHYPREFSGEWQYGYRESIEEVLRNQDQFDQVDVTNLLGRPYIYYLFYTKTDPRDFRSTAKVRRDPFGFVHVDGFGKYRFGDDLSKLDNENKRILYVNSSARAPQKANFFATVNLLNGDPVLAIYEVVYVHEN